MPFPIAYIAGSFPARSETFVYREVRELRRRGWEVRTISLNDPKERGLAEFADLEAGTIVVYGAGGSESARATLAEIFRHPIRSARPSRRHQRWIAKANLPRSGIRFCACFDDTGHAADAVSFVTGAISNPQ